MTSSTTYNDSPEAHRVDTLDAERRLHEQNSLDPAWRARQPTEEELKLLAAADTAVEMAEAALAAAQREELERRNPEGGGLVQTGWNSREIDRADGLVLDARASRTALAQRIHEAGMERAARVDERGAA